MLVCGVCVYSERSGSTCRLHILVNKIRLVLQHTGAAFNCRSLFCCLMKRYRYVETSSDSLELGAA